MSGYFQSHETNLVDALQCDDVLTPKTFCRIVLSKQPQNLQNTSPLGVEVNSETYSCSILRTFEEFGCLTLGMIC